MEDDIQDYSLHNTNVPCRFQNSAPVTFDHNLTYLTININLSHFFGFTVLTEDAL